MIRYASFFLIIAVGGLIALGLVVLFSVEQFSRHANFERQLMWLGLGLAVCWFMALADYRWWRVWAWPFFWVGAFLLLLCFAPEIGVKMGGASRWVNVFGFQFQPSELAKLACIVMLANWYATYADRSGTGIFGFFLPGLAAALLVGLVAVEVDIGSATMISAAVGVIMLMAGVRFRWLILGVVGAVGAVATAVTLIPERMARLTAFLDLEAHATDDGLQQSKALQAFGVGGWDGVGLGNVMGYIKKLPYLESDFIFPVIGGELGLQTSLLVVFGFVIIMVAGVTIALNAPDRFGMLLGAGVVGLIVFQAMIHMAVTTAWMPNTGLPLPFVSQGGTNLVMCLAGIGLLLSIHRQAWLEPEYVSPQLKAHLRITPRL